jgi:hypothetical protein
MKRLRRLSRNNVFNHTPEVVENNTVVLQEAGEIVTRWDIHKDEHTLLVTFPEADTATVFGNIANYVEESTNTVEYYAIDLNNTMFDSITEQQTKRTALTLAEAMELSETLVSEINERKETGKVGSRIRVLIKEGDTLFHITEEANTDLYKQLLSHIQYILENGAATGVTIFMEVYTDTSEAEEHHPAFTNAIILK